MVEQRCHGAIHAARGQEPRVIPSHATSGDYCEALNEVGSTFLALVVVISAHLPARADQHLATAGSQVDENGLYGPLNYTRISPTGTPTRYIAITHGAIII